MACVLSMQRNRAAIFHAPVTCTQTLRRASAEGRASGMSIAYKRHAGAEVEMGRTSYDSDHTRVRNACTLGGKSAKTHGHDEMAVKQSMHYIVPWLNDGRAEGQCMHICVILSQHHVAVVPGNRAYTVLMHAP